MAEVAYPTVVTVPNQGSRTNNTRSNIGLTTPTPPENCRVGSATCTVDIPAGTPCYFVSGTTTLAPSYGVALNAASVVDGWTMTDYKAGDVATLYENVSFGYGNNIVAGQNYFLSGSVVGGLATTASTGGLKPIARGIPDMSNKLPGVAKVPRLRLLRDIH